MSLSFLRRLFPSRPRQFCVVGGRVSKIKGRYLLSFMQEVAEIFTSATSFTIRLSMLPSTTSTAGIHAAPDGTETHSGSGQGGQVALDHQPANMSRSGAAHGPPGSGGGSLGPGAAPAGSQAGLGKPEPASISRYS